MSNAMDKRKLIAEVRKRPALWDIRAKEHKSLKILQTAWKDVAVAMGSNVTTNDCSRTWKSVRNTNRVIVKRIELRIQEAKVNGSYNPNNDYGSDWPYLEHMKFVNDIKKPSANDNKSDLEMSNDIDKFKLIAEIRKRPAIWDVNSETYCRTKVIYQTAWIDVAVAMGSNVTVKDCSRTWQNLRCNHRVVVKRIELRIQEAKLNGSYNPNNDYGSDWPYLEHMKFVNDIKKPSVNDNKSDLEMSNAIDKFKLIAEIRKRPATWDVNSEKYRSKVVYKTAWIDVAVAMGSNVTVKDCTRTWQSLRCNHREVVKRTELRIQEAQLNGSYNPNNDYGSKWPYLEHMKFLNDNKKPSVNDNKSVLEMSNAIDKFKLIAEIRKRPATWDVNSEKYRSKVVYQTAWIDVAVAMGSNVTVKDCIRTWQSLRQNHREVVKKIELRIQEAKLNGSYNPNNDYGSDWPFLKQMQFVNDIKKTSVNDNKSDLEMSNEIDKFKLIAEMRMRPALWDNQSEEHRSCLSVPEVWKDLSVSVGSDVKKCQRNWINLCRSYRSSVKHIESRIKEDKLNGSYDPNNDYSSKWAYFEAMQFMKDHTTGLIKLRTSAEKLKLIAEVRNRPELWCNKSKEYIPRFALQKSWEYLASDMGADVDGCKRKWTSLLLAQRAEVKKLELRIKDDKLKGSYNPNNEYRSKWFFYEHMKFCYDIKNPSLMELGNTSVNDNNSDDNDSNQVSEFENMDNYKMEPEIDLDTEVYIPDDEDYDTNSQMYSIEFVSEPNSPQNQESADDKPSSTGGNCTKQSFDQANLLEDIKKEEHNLTKSANGLVLDPEVYIPDDEDGDTDGQMYSIEFVNEQNSPQNQESAVDKPSSIGGNCSKPTYDQANFLEDLEKEEHNLLMSAKLEPELDLDPEVYIPDDEDDDTDSQMYSIEFVSEPNSPQNQESADDKPSSTGRNCTKQSFDQANLLEDIEKEEHNLTKSANAEPGLVLDPEVYIPDDEDYDSNSQMSGMGFLSEPNSPQNQESADDKPSSTGGNCTKRTYDQANFLEDLEKEEHNLTKSSRLDITRSNSMINVGDSDFNFLVSLLPQMKMINNLQNFKFRAKMTNVMFNIMSASSSRNVKSNNKS